MKFSKKVTIFSILFGLIGYIIYDIMVVQVDAASTLSRIIFNASIKFGFLPYAMGIIIGHWTFPRGGRALKFMIVLSCIVLVTFLTLAICHVNIPWFIPLVTVPAGLVIGWRCWGQGVTK